ncbi:long repeat protein copy 1 [Mycoplasma mobile 163K]|uniref:Long repeat protein copy 1 n=1 Tax=Mycoplasma mobile (strain ATCC 43663 / 163K / NCTC 11711) TaxID=267748 RepID=Q6KIR3_MYCM1|nr:long repeat protein copy 1 [Mycoplasma mobile 163K]
MKIIFLVGVIAISSFSFANIAVNSNYITRNPENLNNTNARVRRSVNNTSINNQDRININSFISIAEHIVAPTNNKYASDYAYGEFSDNEILERILVSPLLNKDLSIPRNALEHIELIKEISRNNVSQINIRYTKETIQDRLNALSIDNQFNYTTMYSDWFTSIPTQERLDLILQSDKQSSAYRLLVGLKNANLSPKDLAPNDYTGSFFVEATYNNTNPETFTTENGFFLLEKKQRADNNGFDYTYLIRINTSRVKFDIDENVNREEFINKINNPINLRQMEYSQDFFKRYFNTQENRLAKNELEILLEKLSIKNELGNLSIPKLDLFVKNDVNLKIEDRFFIDVEYDDTYINQKLNTRPFNSGVVIHTPLEIEKILGERIHKILSDIYMIKGGQNPNLGFVNINYKDLFVEKVPKNLTLPNGNVVENFRKTIIRIPMNYFFRKLEDNNFNNWVENNLSFNNNIFSVDGIYTRAQFDANGIILNNVNDFMTTQIKSIEISKSDFITGRANIKINFENVEFSLSEVDRQIRTYSHEFLTPFNSFKAVNINNNSSYPKWVNANNNFFAIDGMYLNKDLRFTGLNFENPEIEKTIDSIEISNSDILNGSANIKINFNRIILQLIEKDFEFFNSFEIKGFQNFDSSKMKMEINNKITPENEIFSRNNKSIEEFKKELALKGLIISDLEYLSKINFLEIYEANKANGSAKIRIQWNLVNEFNTNVVNNEITNKDFILNQDLGLVLGFDVLINNNLPVIIGSISASFLVVAITSFSLWKFIKSKKSKK